MSKNKNNLKNRLNQKFHYIFFYKLNLDRFFLFLYKSYRHGKKYAKANGKKINEIVNENPLQNKSYYLHVPNVGAGIGHQMSNFISGYHYAKAFGLTYIYSPFTDKKWEEFLGFGQGQLRIEDIDHKKYKKILIPFFDDEEKWAMARNIVDSYSDKKVIFKPELDQFYQKQYDVIPFMKSQFEKAPARKNDHLIFDENETNLALHIRRGDITKGQSNGDKTLTKRWLDLDYYERVMEYLTENIKIDKPVHIYLFTQDEDDYSRFDRFGKVTLCLDMSAMDSFLHMVRADILVISKSSFSYNPALLSDGIRICPEGFWHDYPEDEKWIVMK